MSAYPLNPLIPRGTANIDHKVNIMYIIGRSTIPLTPRGKTAKPLPYQVEERWNKAGGAYPLATYQVIDLSWALGLYPWNWSWIDA